MIDVKNDNNCVSQEQVGLNESCGSNKPKQRWMDLREKRSGEETTHNRVVWRQLVRNIDPRGSEKRCSGRRRSYKTLGPMFSRCDSEVHARHIFTFNP